MKNWASSHINVTKIINVQIPDQCEKILGGDIEGALSLTKVVETKQTFYKAVILKEDFKSTFVSSYFINQTLINTHYSTDSNDITKCVSRLSTVDLSHQPSHCEYFPPPLRLC